MSEFRLMIVYAVLSESVAATSQVVTFDSVSDAEEMALRIEANSNGHSPWSVLRLYDKAKVKPGYSGGFTYGSC